MKPVAMGAGALAIAVSAGCGAGGPVDRSAVPSTTVAAPVSILHGTFAPLSRMAQAFIDTLYEMPGAVERPVA